MKKTDTNTDKTESRLEALIAECHQIIREIVLPATAVARDDIERRRYLDSAVELVRTGAAVGDTIARLRGGVAAEHRQRITVERIHTLPTPEGEGG